MSKHYGLSDLHWIDERLYFKGKDVNLKIVPFGEFFKIEWPDGVQSADFYNFTRARQAAKKYILEEHLNKGESLSGAPLVRLNEK